MNEPQEESVLLLTKFIQAYTEFEKSNASDVGKYKPNLPLYVLMGSPGVGKSMIVDRLTSRDTAEQFFEERCMKRSGVGRAAKGLSGTLIPVIRSVSESLQVCDMPGQRDVLTERKTIIDILQRCLMKQVTGESFFVFVFRAQEVKDPRGIEISQCYADLEELMGRNVQHYVQRMFFVFTHIDRVPDMTPEIVHKNLKAINFNIAGAETSGSGGLNKFAKRLVDYHFVVDYRTMDHTAMLEGIQKLLDAHKGQESIALKLPFNSVKDVSDTMLNRVATEALDRRQKKLRAIDKQAEDCSTHLSQCRTSMLSRIKDYADQIATAKQNLTNAATQRAAASSDVDYVETNVKNAVGTANSEQGRTNSISEQMRRLATKPFKDRTSVHCMVIRSQCISKEHKFKAHVSGKDLQLATVNIVVMEFEENDVTLRSLLKHNDRMVPRTMAALKELRSTKMLYNGAARQQGGNELAVVEVTEEKGKGLKIKVSAQKEFKAYIFYPVTTTSEEARMFLTSALEEAAKAGTAGATAAINKAEQHKKDLERFQQRYTDACAAEEAAERQLATRVENMRGLFEEVSKMMTDSNEDVAKVCGSKSQLDSDPSLDYVVQTFQILCVKNDFLTPLGALLDTYRAQASATDAVLQSLRDYAQETTKLHRQEIEDHLTTGSPTNSKLNSSVKKK